MLFNFKRKRQKKEKENGVQENWLLSLCQLQEEPVVPSKCALVYGDGKQFLHKSQKRYLITVNVFIYIFFLFLQVHVPLTATWAGMIPLIPYMGPPSGLKIYRVRFHQECSD